MYDRKSLSKSLGASRSANPFMPYLRSTRMNVAATLLVLGSSATEAAMAVGFDSLSHFSKAFRAEKGVLPSHHKVM
ncbi:helix-turn-helix domain-containing protein [Paracoccus denitrificans]|uniref:helix-turn-helix domain-containing protein n=1 Tax=Paracoccus denitrificans TaxID=266 RepID=UPI0018F825C4|nr:helix-turn-helix domain-containing protein [Paracoccus denitrificans]